MATTNTFVTAPLGEIVKKEILVKKWFVMSSFLG
jgi:hypothetical protein